MNVAHITEKNELLRERGWVAFELLLAVALSVGCWLCFFSMFPNPVSLGATMSAAAAMPALLYLVCRIPAVGRYIVFYVFLLVAVLYAVFYGALWNGFLVLANSVIGALNEQLKLGLVVFATEGGAVALSRDALCALLSVMALLSAAIVHSVSEKRVLLGFALSAAPVMLGLFLKAAPVPLLLTLVILLWSGLFVLASLRGPLNVRKGAPIFVQKEGLIAYPAIFLACVLLLTLVCVTVLGNGGYKPIGSVDKAHSAVVLGSDHLRYDNLGAGKMDGLSQGDLTNTHPLEYTDEVLMHINMQVPRSMYLRGFTGGIFEDDKWSPTPDSAYTGASEGLMVWLAARGFYPQLQGDLLYRMAGDYLQSKVTVDNVAASSKYVYTPYSTALTGDIVPSKVKFYRDGALLSRGLRGERSYTAVMLLPEYGDFDYQKVMNRVAAAKSSADWSEYEVSEQAYRSFVYDTYLEVSPDAASDIASALPAVIGDEDGARSADYVLSMVRRFFDESYAYDTAQGAAEGGRSELDWFLNESKAGDDMHFATAAVLLLRQAGIPARYCEGFYFPTNMMESYRDTPDVDFDVTDSMAHAWVEIYIDEAGWIPAEVIPGYFTLDATKTNEEKPTQDEVDRDRSFYEDEVELNNADKAETGSVEVDVQSDLLFKLLVALCVALALLAVYVVWRRLRARRRYRSLGALRGEQGVYEIYKFVALMMGEDGHGLPADPYDVRDAVAAAYDARTLATVGLGFDEFLHRVCAVRFGGATWADEEYVRFGEYARFVGMDIYRRLGRRRRFVLRWVLFRI